jgi:hypothetical protein
LKEQKMDSPPLYDLGQCVATPGAVGALAASGQSAEFFLDQHQRGHWGSVSEADQRANDAAVTAGERVLSEYRTLLGVVLWVITEADRSSTCVLLPEEY